jgi:hypothetical protein
VFYCPSGEDNAPKSSYGYNWHKLDDPMQFVHCSYGYRPVARQTGKKPRAVLVDKREFERDPDPEQRCHPDLGMNVGYSDGSVRWFVHDPNFTDQWNFPSDTPFWDKLSKLY